MLEDRRLLNGVTLITHGFNDNAAGWVTKMAEAIFQRPDVDVAQPRYYTVTVTDPGHNGGPLDVVNNGHNFPWPDGSKTEDLQIVVLLDWSDVAGQLFTDGSFVGHHRSTVDVAAAVANKLVTPGFLYDPPTAVAELPLHVIGHSRGGSLVAELAHALGKQGVWVDQVTTLDPHSVDGPAGGDIVDWGDAPMKIWNNVVFADDYWRADGINIAEPDDVDGESVTGAYSRQLDESVLGGLIVDPGYRREHGDVPLWYQGTIDTIKEVSDGTTNFNPDSYGWYGGSMPSRTTSGYYFSRIVGGSRSTGEAKAGLSKLLAGEGGRVTITEANPVWPNIINLSLDSPDIRVPIGTPVHTKYFYQDVDSDATTTFYLDTDRNPYNRNEVQTDERFEQKTGATPWDDGQWMHTDSAKVGQSYYVSAKIGDAAGHVRYAYAPGKVTIDPAQAGDAFTIATGGDVWDDPATGGDQDQVMEAREAVRLKLRLESKSQVQNVNAVLFSLSPDIQITHANVYYNDFSAGSSQLPVGWHDISLNFDLVKPQTRTGGFVLSVTYETSNGTHYYQYLPFTNTASPFYWQGDHSAFSIPNGTDFVIEDPKSESYRNNGDGICQTGEAVRIRPVLHYSGVAPATNVKARTAYAASDLFVPTIWKHYSDMSPGDSGYPTDGGYLASDPNYFYEPGTADMTITVPMIATTEEQRNETSVSGGVRLKNTRVAYIESDRLDQDFGVKGTTDVIKVPWTLFNPGSTVLHVTRITTSDLDTTTDWDGQPFAIDPKGSHVINVTITPSGIVSGTRITRTITAESDGRFTDAEHRSNQTTITGLISDAPPVFQAGVGSYPDVGGTAATGNLIVYYSGGTIYAYNAATGTTTVVDSNPDDSNTVRASGNLIVWERRTGSDSHGDSVYDIFARDLSGGPTFLVAGTAASEQLIGVDGTRIAYKRCDYYLSDPHENDGRVYNLYVYDTQSASVVYQTNFAVSGQNPVQYVAGVDYGEGILVWGVYTWSWQGSTWSTYNNPSGLWEWRPAVDSPTQIRTWIPFLSSGSVNNGKIVWSEKDPNNPAYDQIWVWDGNGIPRLLDPNLPQGIYKKPAVGSHVVVYEKWNATLDALFYYSPLGEGILTLDGNSSRNWRLDGDTVAWRDLDGTVNYAMLYQPVLAASAADIAADNTGPFEGQPFTVKVTVHNLGDTATAGPVKLRLYDGDPDAGDRVAPGGCPPGAPTDPNVRN